MLKRFCLVTILSILIFNASASDAIYCPTGKVLNIQSQTGNVIVQIEGATGWKQLGSYSEPALSTRMSMVLAAQATERPVLLAFPLNSGVVCNEPNWNVSPYKVRLSD